MKHYYDDEGILQFTHNNELLQQLALISDDLTLEQLVGPAYHVMHVYDCLRFGIGITIEQWKEKQEKTELERILKLILLDAVERGFLHKEFMLIAFSALVSVKMPFLD